MTVGVGEGEIFKRGGLLHSRRVDTWKRSLKVKPFNAGTNFSSEW